MENNLLVQSNLLKVMITDKENKEMHSNIHDACWAIENAKEFFLILGLDFEQMYKFAKENFYEPDILTRLDADAFQQIFFDFLEGSIVEFACREEIDIFDEDFEKLHAALGNIHILGYDQIFSYENARTPDEFVQRVVEYCVQMHSKSKKYIANDNFEGFMVDGVEILYDDMSPLVKKKMFEFNLNFYKN